MELVENSGFEEGMPKNWQTYATGTVQRFTYPEEGRSGGSSVAIEYANREIGKKAYWVKNICIDRTKKYKLSGWIKTDNIVGDAGSGAYIQVDWKDIMGNHLSSSNIMVAQVGIILWTYFEREIIPDVNATQAAIILVLNDCSGKVWFDDISFSFSDIVPKYKCINGKCVQDPSGSYSSLSDCQVSIKYACINNQCVAVCPDYAGTKYDTLIACQSACKNLIFEEHFDGTSLNTAKWTARNSGLYVPSQVSVSNSNLKIKGELVNGIPKSGLITTRDKFKFKYGLFEARIKYAHGDGARNQIWCQAPTGGNVSMNIEDGVSASVVASTNPCHKRDANVSITTLSGGHDPNIPNAYCLIDTRNHWQDYHIWQMEWTPDNVIFRDNGVEKWRLPAGRIPQAELYISAALCLGKCDTNWSKDINTSQLPFEFLVDYIRVYRLS